VFLNPVSICPSVNAATKFLKFKKFEGSVKTLVEAYSALVLNAAKKTTNTGTINTKSSNINITYFRVVKNISLKFIFLLTIFYAPLDCKTIL
jgi:hypothetical protein